MAKLLHSLERVKFLRDTGQRPLVVSCNDTHDYLCKYATGLPAHELMTEWVVWHLAKSYGLSIPDMAVVNLLPEHIPDNAQVPYWPNGRLQLPMYGSKFVEAIEIDLTTESIFEETNAKNRLLNKHELLHIGIFDLFIANEDRHESNYNLLLKYEKSRYSFITIDHGAAFNSKAALSHGLATLTEHDSIISSKLCRLIYHRSHHLSDYVSEIMEGFEEWTKIITNNYENFVDSAPEEWECNKENWKDFLGNDLLNNGWINQTKDIFWEFCSNL